MRRALAAAVVVGVFGTRFAAPALSAAEGRNGLFEVDHLVVIYLENHSFDNLYGTFPGAEGIADATPESTTQLDAGGAPYTTLPQNDPRIPADLPNGPYDVSPHVPIDQKPESPVHRYYQNIGQIDEGRNDRFVEINFGYEAASQGQTMGYWPTDQVPLAKLARKYVLADHFFQAAFGGSWLNHMWLVCACAPVWPDAPASQRTVLDPATGLPTIAGDQQVVANGDEAINDVASVNTPRPPDTPPDARLPYQDFPSIGERLSAKGLSWKWYAGGWADAVAGRPGPLFQYEHQPFLYFRRYREGSKAKARHLRDETEFVRDARRGHLPAVSFIKPYGEFDEHPGYAAVLPGEDHTRELIDAVRHGPDWKHTAIVVTYDENGGFWDHVAPPKIDRWGPGTRIPAMVISPLAKRGFVDHTVYNTTSILATIEARWKLHPLGARDRAAADLQAAFRKVG